MFILIPLPDLRIRKSKYRNRRENRVFVLRA